MIGRGARRAVLSSTVVVAVVATLGAVPAAATATCGFAGGIVSVALSGDGDSARLTVGTGADAGEDPVRGRRRDRHALRDGHDRHDGRA